MIVKGLMLTEWGYNTRQDKRHLTNKNELQTHQHHGPGAPRVRQGREQHDATRGAGHVQSGGQGHPVGVLTHKVKLVEGVKVTYSRPTHTCGSVCFCTDTL